MRLLTIMAVALLVPAFAFGQFGGLGSVGATPGFNGAPVPVPKTPASVLPTVISTPGITTPRRGRRGPVTSPTVMGIPLPDERVLTRPRARRRRGKC